MTDRRLLIRDPSQPLELNIIDNYQAGEIRFRHFSRPRRTFLKLDLLSRNILLVNDVSIYLQAGMTEDLTRWLDRAATVIANGYWGERLGGGTLTERERTETAKLKAYFERKGRVLILEPRPTEKHLPARSG